MAKQTVSRTALGAAICRAIEQYQPEATRLFYDPVAVELIGAPLKWMLQLGFMRNLTVKQTEAVAQGIYGAQVCRTRYIDEAVQAAVGQGVAQLVILGAGLDTRPYRLPELEGVKVYEIDLPDVQAGKKDRLRKALGRLPEQVAFIPIDFDAQTLDSVFPGTSFDPSRPAVFIWEGVTQYISAAAVERTLAFIGKSAPGSLLVFTYVLKSILEHRSDIPDGDRMLQVVARQSPWIFGLEPAEIPAFLKGFYLNLLADVGNKDYQEQYLKPLGRELVVFEGERIVQGRVE